MTTPHPERLVPWPADGLVSFAATAVDVVAAPEDGPRLLSQAARRLCDAAGPGAVLDGAGGELTADLGAGLRAGMFVSTEMRRDTDETSLLRLHLRLSGEGEPPLAASSTRGRAGHGSGARS